MADDGYSHSERDEVDMVKAEVDRVTRLTESYWPADTSKPLLNKSIGQVLRDAVAAAPDRIALVEGVADPAKRRRWTYSQLLADSEKTASALLAKFKPGERVAVWADNIPEWVVMQLACALSGVLMITVNPANRIREIEYLLGQSEVAGLFLIEEYRGHKMLDTVDQIRKNLPYLREVVSFSKFEDFVKSNSSSKVVFPKINPEDPCIIMYTSGTTGFPKGATLTHNGVISLLAFMAERADLDIGGVWVNVMPMFHIGGTFASLGCITRCATHVMAPAFDPVLVCKLIEEEKGTFTLLVPTMIEMVLNHPDRNAYDLSTLKTIQSGASKVEPELIRRVKEEFNCGMCIAFGQTEAVSITLTHAGDSAEDQSETIGQPYPHLEVKIAHPETGEVLPVDVEGEICVRGFSVMTGYYKMPEASAKAVRDGWLHTGDLGSMDKRGFLNITGRLKDMIIRGGENIYPAEIESAIFSCEGVAEVTVIGVPDPKWGEVGCAIIVAKDPQLTEKAIKDHCLERLAKYKIPKYYKFVKEIPKTGAGKIDKKVVKANIKID